ncbi:MAG: Ryanodine receptor Ryr [Bacteroidetes bacterium]|nr:Ryanodine receptor Ryr [Bacteroidota bacterium]
MKLSYKPLPVILSMQSIPKELYELIEKMAQNVHEEWAEGRIREGWKYGKKRNDIKKENPSLVPYKELSESEKEYDRRTVIASISYLIDNGFEIKKV